MSFTKGVVVKSVAPTATDDITKGYYEGFSWIFSGREYVCLVDTASSAVWEITTKGVFTATVNGATLVEVSQASDIPATLATDTTYVIRGSVTISTAITVTNEGSSIIGFDRNKDKLIWDGATGTTMLTVTDVNFDMLELCLSSNNTGSVLIEADNYDGASFNSGRLKTFTITNCQFRNCFDIASFEGFDLVDISNTLFWYCEAPNFGVTFLNTSKLEISSCEFIRWFDESTIPTPSGFATCPMIELLTDGGGSGLGAVNIGGSVIHPQQTQDGIKINSGSTTGFGTISANTLIDVNLTTGLKFFPDPSTGGYSNTECLNYDVAVNQGIPNSDAYGFFQEPTGGTDTLTGGTTNWVAVEYGAVPSNTELQRFSFSNPATNRGRLEYDGTKSVFVTIQVSFTWNDTSGGTDTYNFGISKNGSAVPELGSILQARASGGAYAGITLTFNDTVTNADDYELLAQNPGGGAGNDVEVISVQFLIKE